jgi:fructose-1,6-bisphosphatase/inositol monophosphatase family enzyme
MTDIARLLDPIMKLHALIRAEVVEACERASLEELSQIDRDSEGDTIYAVDRVSEELLIDFFEREVAALSPVVLIAEGLEGGSIVLPRGASEEDASWRVIVDPIDGTRGLMYQKRSAWILTGVAPNLGGQTGIEDIELAVQTEIPLVKQHLSDTLWARRGQGAGVRRTNRLSGESFDVRLAPSRAKTIAHGFAMIARFFPGARQELAAIDEQIVSRALGPPRPGKALCFEDQYISTGGQLYELMAGHDRFVADLRPLMGRRDLSGLCCHPYDLCTEMIAREMGVIITDAAGGPIRAPLDVSSDVAWAGYANQDIRNQIEPLLKSALEERGLLDGSSV